MKVDLSADRELFLVHAGPRDTDKMKTIPGARWNQRLETWTVPARRGRQLAPSIETADHIGALLRPHAPAVVRDDERLRSYQSEGVRMLTDNSVCLADEMGTGKTVQTLVALPAIGKVIIIAPKTVALDVWQHEHDTWAHPERTAYVAVGTKPKRDKAIEAWAEDPSGTLIINYDCLGAHTYLEGYGNVVSRTDKEREPKNLNGHRLAYVVADEAHRICEPKNKTTRACWALRKQADHAIALTGTPIKDNPDDLWAIMHFVFPLEWPVRSRFRELACDVRPGYWGGVENHGILPHMLEVVDIFLQPRFLRRVKSEVLPELPEKQWVTMKIPLTGKQKKAYDAMNEDMLANIDGEIIAAPDPLQKVHRLRELASAMPDPDGLLGVDGLTGPSNKLDALIDIIDQTDGPVVAFMESAMLCQFITSELQQADYRAAGIWEETTAEARENHLQAFQQDGTLDVICLTTGTSAEGITLTRSNTLVFVQQSWSMQKNKQAEDRIHRFGQDRGTSIIYLISEGTIDEHVFEVSANKEVSMQQVVRDPDFVKKVLS